MNSAALDRWIIGDCWPHNRKAEVVARCKNDHEWDAVEEHSCGTSELDKPECPECGEYAVDVREYDQ